MQHLDPDQNGTLEIRVTRKEDAGSYTCWVKNSAGRRAITATLTVRSNSAYEHKLLLKI